jgi:predicted outer membrane repeat protein
MFIRQRESKNNYFFSLKMMMMMTMTILMVLSRTATADVSATTTVNSFRSNSGRHLLDVSSCLSVPNVLDCLAGVTTVACKAVLNGWNDNGCFCEGVETADISAYASTLNGALLANGISKHESAADSVCIQALLEQSELGEQNILSGPEYVYVVKNSATSFSVNWAASKKFNGNSIVIYAVTPYVAGAGGAPASTSWPYYGISADESSKLVVGGTLSTNLDLSTLDATARANGSVVVILVHAVVMNEDGVSTTKSSSYAATKYSSLVSIDYVEIFASAGSSDVTTSCGDFSSPCASLTTTLQSTKFTSSLASNKRISLLPGTYDVNSCGISIQSLGSVEIVSLAVSSDFTSIDCAYANNFVTISGDDKVSITGVTIQNGRSETGGGLKIENVQTLDSVTLSDVVVKDSMSQNLGGGIHVVNSFAKFENVLVQNCSSGNDQTGNANRGGGVYIEQNSNVTATDLTVKDCFTWGRTLTSGKGGGLNVDEGSTGVFTDTVIENNESFFAGGIYIGNAATPKFINVKVTKNIGNYGSGVGVYQGGFADFVNGTISENTPDLVSETYGSGALIYGNAGGNFENVLFNGNEADYGAAVMAWQESNLITFDRCTFTKNIATVNGGAINAKSSSTIVATRGTLFAANEAQNLGGAIHAEQLSSITLSSSTIVYKNTAKSGGGLSCIGGAITIDSSTSLVENIASSYGGGVYLESSCKAAVQASLIKGNVAGGSNQTVCPRLRGSGGGAFAVIGVYNVSSVSQGATGLDISAGTVLQSNSATDGGAILIISSADAATTSSSGTTSALFSKGAVVNVQGGASLITNKAFGCYGPGKKRGAGGGIYASIGEIDISTTTFSKNIATTHGGGIRVINNVASLTVAGTTMSENVASDGFGGAIANSALLFKVSNACVMSKNVATSGGAISIAPASEESDTVTDDNGLNIVTDFELKSLNLVENIASVLGGGIYIDANFVKSTSTEEQNTLSELQFSSNEAESGPSAYWTRASSPSIVFACENCAFTPADSLATEALKPRVPATDLLSFASGVTSGAVAESFAIELVDYYGNVAVSEASTSTCTVSPAVQTSSTDITDYSGNITRLEFLNAHSPLVVSGTLEAFTEKGISTFEDVRFDGELGDIYRVSFVCKRSNDVQIGDNLIINAEISICVAGYEPEWTNLSNGDEQIQSSRVCSYCKDRTFNLDGIACKACPQGGDCRGGKDLTSLEGWWRSKDVSEYVFQCPMGADACKATGSTGDSACKEAYEGPVCALCKEGYRKMGGKCLACESKPITDAIPILGILAGFGFLVYIFKKPLQEVAGTVLATCTIYVVQTLGLLYSFDVNWPAPMQRTLGILNVSNLNLDALSPGCSNSGNTFYVSYIGALSVPPIILFLTFVAYSSASALKNTQNFLGFHISEDKLTEFQGKLKRNCVWMLVLTYAGVTKTVLQLFNSRTLDVGTYLRADYNIKAEGQTFNAYLGSAYLAMIIYPFGLPVFIAWKLLKKRPEEGKLSKSDSLRSTYGFLYKNTRAGCEGWELVLLATKFFLAAIPVFATERNLRGVSSSGYDTSSEFASACQIAMAQMLCGSAFCLALYIKPYGQPLHNRQFSLAIGTVISWLACAVAVFANPLAFTSGESNGVGAALVIFSLVTLAYGISASAQAGEKPFTRGERNKDGDSEEKPSFWKSQSLKIRNRKVNSSDSKSTNTDPLDINEESETKPLAAEV